MRQRPTNGLGVFGGPTAIGTRGALGFDSADMEAINVYMMNTAYKTEAARKLRDDWVQWYNDLWPGQKYLQSTYDEARNRRNAFNLANTTTTSEYNDVKRVITTGMTTEEMQGETKRTTSEGMFPKSSTDTGVSWLPSTTTGWLLVGGVTVVGLYALTQVTKLAAIFKGDHS